VGFPCCIRENVEGFGEEREREIEKEKKERGLKFLGWENRRHFMLVGFLSLCGGRD
jgi:hypothetical protein